MHPVEQTRPPCQEACPAGIDIPAYVALIGQGRFAEAVSVILRDNPFPWVCGLICPRPCERACLRGRIDGPVAIKALKAFAAEQAYGESAPPALSKGSAQGQKIAIVGAGPAGLSAAYYLAQAGYAVTVFEALPEGGGMMLVGIPRFRLPREVIRQEVARIAALGVDFHFDCRLGRDISLAQLHAQDFRAVLLAIGAHRHRPLGIPGEKSYPQVVDALEILSSAARAAGPPPGNSVVVIGGGNVAIDAARTCVRLGAAKVVIAYRRGREEMPADDEEVRQAEEEGVGFAFLTIPAEVVGAAGRLTSLRCLRAELVADGQGRRRPVPVAGSDFHLEADCVVSAIGEDVDDTGLRSIAGLEWTARGTIGVDPAGLRTSLPGIFAAGDAVSGPATVVQAIGAGKRAATAIDHFLGGRVASPPPPAPERARRPACLEIPVEEKLRRTRAVQHLADLRLRRTTFSPVELGLTAEAARAEAGRCLRCDLCLHCGRCVEACRKVHSDSAPPTSRPDGTVEPLLDLPRSEECILCGACAAQCPTGALALGAQQGEGRLDLCGAVLRRARLQRCQECGAELLPQALPPASAKRLRDVPRAYDGVARCPCGARRRAAAALSTLPAG